ncbi:hypothetical protein [Helicobacter sp.]|uniref:hypothetical protein n=1 Tax=Helicobacter sp. TaxID=218 RepID=UPI0019862098|nr:hypothetical protein [Helicobacter sp.]MBD5165822.1 hypothetical protein [Helicobacter sp.]
MEINKDKDVKQNAYRIYQDNGQSGSKKEVLQDRITSIELKILKTRFSLEFDGQSLSLLENQRIIGEWKARSGIPIENLKEDSKENQERQRFCIPNTNNQSFYYDLYLHKEENTKPIQEGEYSIEVTYNPNSLDLKGIDLDLLGEQKERFKEDICKTLQMYKIQENLLIPLKVQYQKRILIVIERFKQTTESTKSRMNIYIDRKRVDKNGNIIGEQTKQYEYYNPNVLPTTNPYAYILERPGPDSIGGELKLRIPSGRYNVEWKDSNNLVKC